MMETTEAFQGQEAIDCMNKDDDHDDDDDDDDDDDKCLCESHPKHECMAYCKTCDGQFCKHCVSIKHKSHEITELSDQENLIKGIPQKNGQLQPFRYKLEAFLRDMTKKLSTFFLVIIFSIIVYFIFQKSFEIGTENVSAQEKEGYQQFAMDERMEKLHREVENLKREIDVAIKKQKREFEVMIDDAKKINQKSMKDMTENVTALGEEWHKQILKKLHQELEVFQTANNVHVSVAVKKQKRDFVNMIGSVKKIHQRRMDELKKENNAALQNQTRKLEDMTRNAKKHHQELDDLKKENEALREKQREFEKMIRKLEQKIFPAAKLEQKIFPAAAYDRKLLQAPSVSFVIDTGFNSNEKYNCLYDMAVTDDKKVWMGGHSRELKLFDLTGTLRRTVPISCFLMSICMYNKQVVFSDYKDNAIKKITDDGTTVTMFTTGGWAPQGITGSASGDLLVCLSKDDQSKVVRYSSTGTVLQEIQYDSQGGPLYQTAWYISENVNGDIIVTDSNKKTVTTVDRLGIFRYSYSGEESSFSPNGVVTDSAGHVLVADFQGDRIHMLDRDGRFMRYIFPVGGLKRPRALAMIGDGEMIVGECMTGLAKTIKYLKEKN